MNTKLSDTHFNWSQCWCVTHIENEKFWLKHASKFIHQIQYIVWLLCINLIKKKWHQQFTYALAHQKEKENSMRDVQQFEKSPKNSLYTSTSAISAWSLFAQSHVDCRWKRIPLPGTQNSTLIASEFSKSKTFIFGLLFSLSLVCFQEIIFGFFFSQIKFLILIFK